MSSRGTRDALTAPNAASKSWRQAASTPTMSRRSTSTGAPVRAASARRGPRFAPASRSSSSDMAADRNFKPWIGEASVHGFRSCMALPVIVDGEVDGCLSVYASEPHAFAGDVADLMKDLASELGFGLKRLRDHELLLKALKDQTLLSKAIDQASESIVVTDTESTILYANPSAVRTSGYALDEMLGQNPRMFQSELHDSTFFQSMWSHLSRAGCRGTAP